MNKGKGGNDRQADKDAVERERQRDADRAKRDRQPPPEDERGR